MVISVLDFTGRVKVVDLGMRKKRKRLVLLASVLLFVFIVLSIKKKISHSLYETVSGLVCDEKGGKAALLELCQSYSEGKVAGNLCKDICQTNQLIIDQCLSHKNDNVIFSVKWKQQNAVLKAKKMSSYNSWDDVFSDSSSLTLPELQKRFVAAVYDHVVLELIQFNQTNKKPTLPALSQNALLAQLYFNASPTRLSQTEMQSLWMLLQQDEYFLMQLLKDFKHMPKIYGTCGKFYVLEKVQTLMDFVGVGLFSAAVTWGVRVRLALELMDFIQELDSKRSYGLTWQHCDIQASNFGVNNAGRIKAIDVDLMYTGEKMIELLGQQIGNCSSHKDCEFFDCASLCNMKGKMCTSVRISNNLQVICRDLFKSSWYEGGLLASIPSQSEKKLNKILDECTATTTIPWTKHKFNRIFNTLKRYLLDEQNPL